MLTVKRTCCFEVMSRNRFMTVYFGVEPPVAKPVLEKVACFEVL